MIDQEFENFWKAYRAMADRHNDIGDKREAVKAYRALRKKESLETIIKATNGYADFLKYKKLEENFPQRKMYASTFLRQERWKRFLGFKHEPRL